MNYTSSSTAPMAGSGSAHGAPALYGGVVDAHVSPMHLSKRRRRMRAAPCLLAVVLPFAVFACIFAVLSFYMHYAHPLCTAALVLGAAVALIIGGGCVQQLRQTQLGDGRDPSWLWFVVLSMMFAWAMAVIVGLWNYDHSMKPHYEQRDLNTYFGVSPASVAGPGMMDAGSVVFIQGTRLDISKSMGFKHNDVYCAAPITFGNNTLATYDFWAVGRNCCTGSSADFHCDGFNVREYSSALRLTNDEDRAFYRLAVQQAEATHKIQALHPLFFTWVRDAPAIVEGWKDQGVQNYITGIICFLVLQSLLALIAALAFSYLPAK